MTREETIGEAYRLIDDVRSHSKNRLPNFTDQQIWWALVEADTKHWAAAQAVLLEHVIERRPIPSADHLPSRPPRLRPARKKSTPKKRARRN